MKKKLPVGARRLIEAAERAKKYAKAPYSGLRVGAAVATKSGKIFTGCNIENSSFGLTICAERVALFKAVSEGQTGFSAIAISTDSQHIVTPCGACRQVLVDLAGDIDVILASGSGAFEVHKLRRLLPIPFNDTILKNL